MIVKLSLRYHYAMHHLSKERSVEEKEEDCLVVKRQRGKSEEGR